MRSSAARARAFSDVAEPAGSLAAEIRARQRARSGPSGRDVAASSVSPRRSNCGPRQRTPERELGLPAPNRVGIAVVQRLPVRERARLVVTRLGDLREIAERRSRRAPDIRREPREQRLGGRQVTWSCSESAA